MSPEQVAIARIFDTLEVVEYAYILSGLPEYARRTPTDLVAAARSIAGEHNGLNGKFAAIDTRDALEWVGENPDEIIDGPYRSDRTVTKREALNDMMRFLSYAARLTEPLISKYNRRMTNEVVVSMSAYKGYLDVPVDDEESVDNCDTGSHGMARDVLVEINKQLREEVEFLREMSSNKDKQIERLMRTIYRYQLMYAVQTCGKPPADVFEELYKELGWAQ